MLQWLGSLAFLSAALFVGARTVPPSELAARLGAFSPGVLCLAALLGVVQLAAQAVRLWLVFPHARRPSLLHVSRAFALGQFLNSCLPCRAGDVAKVVCLARPHPPGRTSTAEATAAVLADKGLDFTAMGLLTLALGRRVFGMVPNAPTHSTLFVGIGLGVATAVLILIRRRLPHLWRKVGRAIHEMTITMRSLTPSRLGKGLMLAVLVSAAEIAVLILLSRSVGISLGIGAAFTVIVVLCVGVAIPVSIASVGAFEAAIAFALHHFGVPMADALAIGTVHHAIQLTAISLVALAFWRGRSAALVVRKWVSRGAQAG